MQEKFASSFNMRFPSESSPIEYNLSNSFVKSPFGIFMFFELYKYSLLGYVSEDST